VNSHLQSSPPWFRAGSRTIVDALEDSSLGRRSLVVGITALGVSNNVDPTFSALLPLRNGPVGEQPLQNPSFFSSHILRS
jgi:hypothetical protein